MHVYLYLWNHFINHKKLVYVLVLMKNAMICTCFGRTVHIFAYGTNTRTFHSRFVPIAEVVVMLDLRSAAILLLAVLVAILVLVVASALYQGRRTSLDMAVADD